MTKINLRKVQVKCINNITKLINGDNFQTNHSNKRGFVVQASL